MQQGFQQSILNKKDRRNLDLIKESNLNMYENKRNTMLKKLDKWKYFRQNRDDAI